MLKEKGGVVNKKFLFIVGVLLLCVAFAVVEYALPAYGSEESLTATATVTSPSAESYGASVAASSQVFLPWHALGKPDGWGAWMLRRGWVDIELEDVVTDCNEVSIWARRAGWGFPRFDVYVSADGSSWIDVGSGSCTSKGYTRYDFSGDFGDVEYVKVRRNGSGRWSMMMLDAVVGERG